MDIGRSALCESEKWRNRSMMRCEGNRFILFFFCAFVHCRNWFSNTEFDVRKFDVWCSNWLERWMKIKRSLAGRRNHAGLEAGVDRVKSIYCLLADCKNRISKIRSLVFEYIGKVYMVRVEFTICMFCSCPKYTNTFSKIQFLSSKIQFSCSNFDKFTQKSSKLAISAVVDLTPIHERDQKCD